MAFISLCALLPPATSPSQSRHSVALYEWKNVLAIIGSDLNSHRLFSELGCLESLYCPSEAKTDLPRSGHWSPFPEISLSDSVCGWLRMIESRNLFFFLYQFCQIELSSMLEIFSLLFNTVTSRCSWALEMWHMTGKLNFKLYFILNNLNLKRAAHDKCP